MAKSKKLCKFLRRYYAECVFWLRLSERKFHIAFDNSFWHGSLTSFFKMKNKIFDEICVSITLELHIFKYVSCVHGVNITSKIFIRPRISLTNIEASYFSYLYAVCLDFILSCLGLIILYWSDYFVFPYFERITLSDQLMKNATNNHSTVGYYLIPSVFS